MDAIPAQLSAVFGSLVDDVQEQLNEIKRSQTSLLKEVESLKSKQDHFQAAVEALPPWRQTIESKVSQVQAQCEEMATSSGAFDDSLADLKTENRQLQGAVDEILAQHNYLSARVQTVAQVQALPADGAIAFETDTVVAGKSQGDELLRRPQPVAHALASRQTLADGCQSHSLPADAQTFDLSHSSTRSRAGLSASGHVTPVNHEALVDGPVRASSMLPPQPRHEREVSLASSVTFCSDAPAATSVMTLQPPPTAARANLSAVSVLRSKRKHSAQEDNAHRNESTEQAATAKGSKKKQRNTASTGDVNDLRSQRATSKRADTKAISFAKRMDVAEPSNFDIDQGLEALKPHSNSARAGTPLVDHESSDEEEIIVAPRKSAVVDVERTNEGISTPNITSLDHAALVEELLESVATQGTTSADITSPDTTSPRGPESSSYRPTQSSRVAVVVPVQPANPAETATVPSVVRDGPLPPPKTPKLVGLAEMHQQFGVRNDGKENVVPVTGEVTPEAIAFGTVRRSGRALKPKKAHGK